MSHSNYSYKLDWNLAQKRWDAFWSMESVDRPCMSIVVPRTDAKEIPLLPINSIEEQWLKPEYQLALVLRYLEGNHFCGEAVPKSPHLMAGTVTGCGDNLYFHAGGISIRPTMSSIEGPLNWRPGPDDPWRPQVEAVYSLLLDNAPGHFIVSCPGQFTHIDLLQMLRGNEETMLDLVTAPEQVKARLLEMRSLSAENEAHFRDFINARQGNDNYTSWTGLWSREPFCTVQADAAACISPEMFAEFVLPELDEQYEQCQQLLHYHTCGYKQHLELCLSRPYIKVFQYSPNPKEPPNGPGHLEFYRRIQAAGRCLDITVSPKHLEFVVRHLRPDGLHIATTAASVAEAEELLEKSVQWCGTHINQ